MINLSRSNDQHGSRVERRGEKQKTIATVARPAKQRFGKVSRYEELKTVVQTYLENRENAKAALKEIHDQHLYKKEYKTFEAFCQAEYGVSRATAYRLLGAGDEQEQISNETKAINVSKRDKSISPTGYSETAQSSLKPKPKIIDIEPSHPANHRGKPNQLSVNPDQGVMDEPEFVKHCPTCRCGE